MMLEFIELLIYPFLHIKILLSWQIFLRAQATSNFSAPSVTIGLFCDTISDLMDKERVDSKSQGVITSKIHRAIAANTNIEASSYRRQVAFISLPTELLTFGATHLGNFPDRVKEQMRLTLIQSGYLDPEAFTQVKLEVFPSDFGEGHPTWQTKIKLDGSDQITGIEQSTGEIAVPNYNYFLPEINRILEFENYRRELREMLKGKITSEDMQKVEWALLIAEIHHRGQKRVGGDLYLSHPFESTKSLIKECRIYDVAMICAQLTHDVLEDSPEWGQKAGEVRSSWLVAAKAKLANAIGGTIGEEVAEIVASVSKPIVDHKEILTPRHALYIYKGNMQNSLRGIMIKMNDRLHNLRTIFVMEPEDVINTVTGTIGYFETFEIALRDKQYSEAATYLLNEMWKIISPLSRQYRLPVKTPHWVTLP